MRIAALFAVGVLAGCSHDKADVKTAADTSLLRDSSAGVVDTSSLRSTPSRPRIKVSEDSPRPVTPTVFRRQLFAEPQVVSGDRIGEGKHRGKGHKKHKH